MIAPKEKAKELVDKFSTVGLQQRNEGIPCALISVEDTIAALDFNQWQNRKQIEYYQEVKKEIEKL